MSDTTSKLQLPILAADQAQKHVTHNEALLHLDALVQAAVIDRDLSAPPATPAAGDAYIVAAAASGDWSGKEGQLAVWRDNAWYFHQPREGWRVWVQDEDVLLVFDGAGWITFSGGGGGGGGITSLNPADGGMVGINTTATTTSRLSAKSAEVTFDHDGASMQLKLNKAAAADKAHILLYDNWSGRAEIGLIGNDDLAFKVSADGSAWTDALVLSAATGDTTARRVLSGTITIADDAVGSIPTPNPGGMIAICGVHQGAYPQVQHSGILAYDTGSSLLLETLALASRMDNRGTATLTGTTGTDGRTSVAVRSGHIDIENRGGNTRTFSYVFLC